MNTQPIILRVTKQYNFPAEQVFDAWLDPEKAGKFLFATQGGEMVRTEIDARVGGHFNFTDRRDGKDVVHIGEYLEIDRPRRLVFSFSVDGSDSDRISIDIVPMDGSSELTLIHELHPDWAEYADRSKQGWATILESLEKVLSEG